MPRQKTSKYRHKWPDGTYHTIPYSTHRQNTEARKYGINLDAPVSAPLTNQQAYGAAERAADLTYGPQIQAAQGIQAAMPSWYQNYINQSVRAQQASQAYAQPMLNQANAWANAQPQAAPGIDPGSRAGQQSQQAATSAQGLAQLGASTLAAIPAALNTYLAGQQTVAARDLPQQQAYQGQQVANLRAQRGNEIATQYQGIRQNEQNAAIAYGTLGLNQEKAAADTDIARGVDPVTGRSLPQEAPTGYAPGAPGLNSYGYTADEWARLSDKEKAEAREGKGGSQADKDAKKEAEKQEKKRAAIKKATGKLKTRINEARSTWERYARMQNPATKYDPTRGENVPDIDPKTGKQRTKRATPDQIKQQMRKDGYSETEIHVMLMIRAGKPLTAEDVQALRGIDPNIRIPREWLKSRSSRPATSRPGNAPARPGSSEQRPT